MNTKQLREAGVPETCIPSAVEAVARGARSGIFADRTPQEIVAEIVRAPEVYFGHRVFDVLARNLVEHQSEEIPGEKRSIGFRQWGEEIDESSKQQMREACSLPVSVAAALMPDAHVGYGLPIGGVLATENAIIPYAVGVDIACRMKLSVYDVPAAEMKKLNAQLVNALRRETQFGTGGEWKDRREHDVMDEDWTVSPVTNRLRDKAAR